MLIEEDKTSQPYHHGKVKESLVSEAVKLIEADAVEEISLRRLAREVGVTPSAVYNHFTDKNALMIAIKIRLYEDFNRFFDRRCQESDQPERDLTDMCIAYYQFAQKHPSRFRFLFQSALPMDWSSPELVRVACRSIARARRLVHGIFKKYELESDEQTVVNTSLLVWSQLHGIVTLKESGSIRAAVIYQDWPVECAMMDDLAVEQLIVEHIAIIVKGILSSRLSTNRH